MGSRQVITEEVVLQASSRGETTLRVAVASIITPLARDTARELGIRIVFGPDGDTRPTTPLEQMRRAVIGSDHGGFELKQTLTSFLENEGWTVQDMGTHSTEPCDYPDFAFAIARSVSLGEAPFGIMIDGAGPGSAIVCNKVPGIRAACAYNEFAAWNARAHNNCNVLTLGSRATGTEVCKRIAMTFLTSPFEGGRHTTRVSKIDEIEAFFSRDR